MQNSFRIFLSWYMVTTSNIYNYLGPSLNFGIVEDNRIVQDASCFFKLYFR